MSFASFISHDAPDENGVRAEVEVLKGTAPVVEIRPNDDGSNARISVQSAGQKYPVSGWVNTDQDVYKVIDDAYNNGTEIEYRIEHQRRKSNRATREAIPRDTPLSELWTVNGKKSSELVRDVSINLFVGAAKPSGEMKFSNQALTNPREDPSVGESRSALNMDPSELSATKPAVAPATQVNATAHAGGNNGFNEPQAWYSFTRDGAVNPGSYLVQSYISMYAFLMDEARKNDVELNDKMARSLSVKLNGVADKLQLDAYGNTATSPDRCLGSNARARDAVRAVISSVHPMTPEDFTDTKHVNAWYKKVANSSLSLYKWAIEESNNYADQYYPADNAGSSDALDDLGM